MKNVSIFSGLLPLIGFIEFFERFGFYTMQGILVLFLMKTKQFSSTDAFHIYGAFFSLVYAFVGLGGLCGDKILGPQKTLLLGLAVMFLGYMGLSIGPDSAFFPSLAAVCIGNAFFKANPANMLAKIYQEDKHQLHSAFTIFYMSVNIGALLALIVGPFLSSRFSYHYAFGASAIGILFAIIFVIKNSEVLRLATGEIDSVKNKLLTFGGLFLLIFCLWGSTSYLIFYYDYVILGLKIIIGLALSIFIFAALKESNQVKRRLLAVIILMLEAVVFFTLYNQMPTSINLYAVLHVHPQIFGIEFDPQSFQALNPFWIIIWSPFLAKFYIKNAEGKHPLSIFHKFAAGMFSCGLSYIVLYVSHFFIDQSLHVSPLWLVVSYIFQSLAELLVSALGLAMVAELVPASWMGGVMGMWFLTSAVSGFTGASLASLIAIPKNMEASYASLNQFSTVFYEIACVVLFISLLMFLSVKYMKKLTA
jgi:POT family proton-dependent oligopeptide transporter